MLAPFLASSAIAQISSLEAWKQHRNRNVTQLMAELYKNGIIFQFHCFQKLYSTSLLPHRQGLCNGLFQDRNPNPGFSVWQLDVRKQLLFGGGRNAHLEAAAGVQQLAKSSSAWNLSLGHLDLNFKHEPPYHLFLFTCLAPLLQHPPGLGIFPHAE